MPRTINRSWKHTQDVDMTSILPMYIKGPRHLAWEYKKKKINDKINLKLVVPKNVKHRNIHTHIIVGAIGTGKSDAAKIHKNLINIKSDSFWNAKIIHQQHCDIISNKCNCSSSRIKTKNHNYIMDYYNKILVHIGQVKFICISYDSKLLSILHNNHGKECSISLVIPMNLNNTISKLCQHKNISRSFKMFLRNGYYNILESMEKCNYGKIIKSDKSISKLISQKIFK